MRIENEREPQECENIEDIREEIDQLDNNIITLIGKRFQYVKEAVKFKTSEVSVRDPDRVRAMLQERRQWAEENDLNADVIEDMYRDLIDYFITAEMKNWGEESNA